MPSDNRNDKRSFFSDFDFKREWNSIKANVESEWNDLKTSFNEPQHWNSTLRKESSEVADFYITAEQREQLKQMKPFKAMLHRIGWIFKAMFEKLSPERRVMSLLGIVFIIISNPNNSTDFFGGFLLIVVILLELKDKLMAHDELEEGRHIQELLMPERTPTVNGWNVWLYTRSANEVCGDLIDFLRMSDGRMGVAIADVAGKGLHAALLTTKLQATIRALAFDRQALSVLVEKVNTIFHRDSPSHLFASLVYVEFTESESTLRFVNAGHLPAFVRKNDAVEETAKGDLALGLTANARFREQSVDLRPGDLLVLYSDGLTEARNHYGEFFGKERLMTLVRNSSGTSEQTGHTILRAVDAFIGTTKPSDDLSVIILQKK